MSNENKFNMLVDYIQKKFDCTTQILTKAVNDNDKSFEETLLFKLFILGEILDKIDKIEDYDE
jgi:hypothetical protein